MIRIGKHDELITFLSVTEVIDNKGDEQETWTPLTSEWAERNEIGAREVLRNPQIRGVVDVIFRIRHPAVVLNTKMRIKDDSGRLYEITGITPLEGRRVGFEIQAKSLDAIGATVA